MFLWNILVEIMYIFHKKCTLNYSVRIFVKNYINIV